MLADRALFIGFGALVRSREERAREMAMYTEAVKKVGHGAHALAGAHNGG